MKLLLDMYKGVSKDQRDKVQLMATEKKLRSEIDELRNQLKKVQVNNKFLALRNVYIWMSWRGFSYLFIAVFLFNRKVNVKSAKN